MDGYVPANSIIGDASKLTSSSVTCWLAVSHATKFPLLVAHKGKCYGSMHKSAVLIRILISSIAQVSIQDWSCLAAFWVWKFERTNHELIGMVKCCNKLYLCKSLVKMVREREWARARLQSTGKRWDDTDEFVLHTRFASNLISPRTVVNELHVNVTESYIRVSCFRKGWANGVRYDPGEAVAIVDGATESYIVIDCFIIWTNQNNDASHKLVRAKRWYSQLATEPTTGLMTLASIAKTVSLVPVSAIARKVTIVSAGDVQFCCELSGPLPY
jgi:hypothetical protein